VIPLICITPPHVVPVPNQYLDYRVKVRGNCSLCWYKSNCWPPLFTLFRSRNFPFVLISMRACIYTFIASRYQNFEILIDNAQTQYMFSVNNIYWINCMSYNNSTYIGIRKQVTQHLYKFFSQISKKKRKEKYI
jgi:hypothetical protein